MKQFPEIRVIRQGPRVREVVWVPGDGGEPVDLFTTYVTKIEKTILPGSAPVVSVSFLARLVEVDEP